MDDEHAFFGAIRAAPADPVPRLVYADWLEEHGDAGRAEYLRLRVESAQLPPDDPATVRLRRREWSLVEGALAHWLLIPDAPVWCLLGGGLADPVPPHVAQLNVESWQRMAGFYVEFGGPQWSFLTALSSVVKGLATTDVARLFMAGQSMTTFIVSTADQYGAIPDGRCISGEVTRDRQIHLNYHYGWKSVELVSSAEGETRPQLVRLLARLWADTRGQPK